MWALGLRNPWRFSFDRATGDLWIGDVGQNQWEEIDFAPPETPGRNYGWDRMEGTHSYAGGSPPAGHVPPIWEYSHAGGNCSVTGGYVYRGAGLPGLQGWYVYGDYCAGNLIALRPEGGRIAEQRALGVNVPSLSSFGEGADGELFACSLDGGLFRITN